MFHTLWENSFLSSRTCSKTKAQYRGILSTSPCGQTSANWATPNSLQYTNSFHNPCFFKCQRNINLIKQKKQQKLFLLLWIPSMQKPCSIKFFLKSSTRPPLNKDYWLKAIHQLTETVLWDLKNNEPHKCLVQDSQWPDMQTKSKCICESSRQNNCTKMQLSLYFVPKYQNLCIKEDSSQAEFLPDPWCFLFN